MSPSSMLLCGQLLSMFVLPTLLDTNLLEASVGIRNSARETIAAPQAYFNVLGGRYYIETPVDS